jgi:hypothetical protein
VIVMIYLVAVLAAAVVSAFAGTVEVVWAVAKWSPWYGAPGGWGGEGLGFLVLAVLCPLRAWMLWIVLRGPAVGPRPSPKRLAVLLRGLVYLAVAVELLDGLFDVAEMAVSLVIQTALVVVFTLVLGGVPAAYRILALVLGLAGTLGSVLLNVGAPFAMFMVEGLALAGWQAMVLAGQRRDGRWSAATIGCGWLALAFSLVLLTSHAIVWYADVPAAFFIAVWVLDLMHVFSLVWWARSAHDLAEARAFLVTDQPGGDRHGEVTR